MHAYSTDAEERKNVPIIIGVASIALAFGMDQALALVGFKAPWWVDTPAVMGWYAVLHQLHENFLWRKEIFGFRPSSIPNLSGTWIGTAVSDFDDSVMHEVLVRITQTWSLIRIDFETERSRSSSLMAAVNLREGPAGALRYEYRNDPRPGAPETMEIHWGTARLLLSVDGKKVDGDYYSGRGRKNIGALKLGRVSDQLLDWEAARNASKSTSKST